MPDGASGVFGIALAHGLVLAVMVTALMGISGGHLNPAVTIGLLVARRTESAPAAAYIVAQLVGAVLAALVLLKALSIPIGVGARRLARHADHRQRDPVPSGHPDRSGDGLLPGLRRLRHLRQPGAARASAASASAWRCSFDILVGGPLTGAAVNPARAFGPALVAGQWVAHVVYWVGPILGGVLAALLWEYVLLPRSEGAAAADSGKCHR